MPNQGKRKFLPTVGVGVSGTIISTNGLEGSGGGQKAGSSPAGNGRGGANQYSDHSHNTRQKRAKVHDEVAVAEVFSEDYQPVSYWLKLHPQPPRNPFVNVYFHVKVFLMERGPNKKEHMKIGHSVPIYVELLYENGDLVENQHLLELHPNSDCQIRGDGCVELQFRLRELSMNHENKKFCLRFSCPNDRQLGAIDPVESRPMLSIRHCLRFTNTLPDSWYKDEGGRDKCIELNALLIDERNSPVFQRAVPLAVSLVYEHDHQDVKNQSILKVNNGVTPKIDNQGACRLRIRIEEVSKNHQKQAFCVKVAPDTDFSPANGDIAPVFSNPVRVLSKRNRRRKSTACTDNNDHKQKRKQTTRNTLGGRYQASSSSTTYVKKEPQRNHPPAQKIQKLLPPAVTTNNSAPFDCVKGWCSYVFDGMKDLQWCHCGYEINDDGSIDHGRPLFRCPSCWVYKDAIKNANHKPDCMIHLALRAYTSQVQKKLAKLSQLQMPLRPQSHMHFQKMSLAPVSPSGGSTTITAMSPKAGAFSLRGSQGSNTMLSSVGSPSIIKKDKDMESPILQSKMPAIGDWRQPGQGRLAQFSLLAPSLGRDVSAPDLKEGSHSLAGLGINPPPPLGMPALTPPTSTMSNGTHATTIPQLGRTPSMPTMEREISMAGMAGFFGSQPTLGRTISQPSTPAALFLDHNSAMHGVMGSQTPGISTSHGFRIIPEENKIFAILGIQKKHGLPCFDKNDKCIGFYRYYQGNGALHSNTGTSSSNLAFVKLVSVPLDEKSDEMKKIQAEYLDCKNSPDDAKKGLLIRKVDCIELERMKEKALLLHFELAAEKEKDKH